MQHGVCHDCWEQLPWYRKTVERQELNIHVACGYQYPIDRIIQQFKYEQQLNYRQLLTASILTLRLPKVQAIVPMPISTERLIERGYNQSLVIAKILARELNVPVWQPVIRLAQHSQKGDPHRTPALPPGINARRCSDYRQLTFGLGSSPDPAGLPAYFCCVYCSRRNSLGFFQQLLLTPGYNNLTSQRSKQSGLIIQSDPLHFSNFCSNPG